MYEFMLLAKLLIIRSDFLEATLFIVIYYLSTSYILDLEPFSKCLTC